MRGGCLGEGGGGGGGGGKGGIDKHLYRIVFLIKKNCNIFCTLVSCTASFHGDLERTL